MADTSLVCVPLRFTPPPLPPLLACRGDRELRSLTRTRWRDRSHALLSTVTAGLGTRSGMETTAVADAMTRCLTKRLRASWRMCMRMSTTRASTRWARQLARTRPLLSPCGWSRARVALAWPCPLSLVCGQRRVGFVGCCCCCCCCCCCWFSFVSLPPPPPLLYE